MKIEVSHGEIVDKLSILNIKKDKITDEVKLVNINKEFLYLHEVVFSKLNISYDEDYIKLLEVNKILWDVEDNPKWKLEDNNKYNYEIDIKE